MQKHLKLAPVLISNPSKAVLIVHGLVTAGVLLLGLTTVIAGQQGTPYLLMACSLLLLVLFGWSVWSWKIRTHCLFDPYILFLLSAYLYHGGQLILLVFGFRPERSLIAMYPPEELFHAVLLVLIALSAFHLGGLLAARSPCQRSLTWCDPTHITNVRTIGWTLILVSLVPYLLVMGNTVQLRVDDVYSALYQQEAGSGMDLWVQVLAGFFPAGACFLLAGSRGHRLSLVVSVLVILIVVSANLFCGFRSHSFMPLLAAAWLWHRCVRPLPATGLLIGAAALVVILPVVGVLRDETGREALSFEAVTAAYSNLDNPFVAILNEMGGSLGIVKDTIDLVPATRSFDYGLGYLHTVLNCIPNFLTAFHFDLKNGTISDWYNAEYAPIGTGLGFSFIAEAYAAFGWFGVPAIMLLMGFGIAKVILWGSRFCHPAAMAAVATWAILLLHFPRNASEGYVRQLVWTAMIPYLAVNMLDKTRRRRDSKTRTVARAEVKSARE